MHDPIVRFEDVEFRRTGHPPILAGIRLSLHPGETLALVGRSGAGKTTLLKLVNGLLLPSAGRVLVQGRETTAWDGIQLRRRIGYVFQETGLFPHMSIEENVSVVPRLERWTPPRTRDRVYELLEMLGLPPATYAARRPHELSGGQRQRVGLARALAVDPPMLLMDEPFGALDPLTRAEVRGEFVRLQRQLETTVIVVTHDMAEALALGSRIGVMEAGAIIALGTPPQIAATCDPRVQALLRVLPQPAAPVKRP